MSKKSKKRAKDQPADTIPFPEGGKDGSQEAPAESANGSPTNGEKPPEVKAESNGHSEPMPVTPEAKEKIKKALARIGATTSRWANLKEETKGAKEDMEAAHSHLADLARELVTDYPLFDRKPEGNGQTNGTLNGHDQDDSWRAFAIAELGLPSGIVEKLAAVDIETMGDLQDYSKRNSNYSDPITRIKGIGAAAGSKIEEATARFWEERPDRKETVKS